ncbi:hypothetical protein [Lacimicrobium alkaliphilum]|uniref:Uncharacterized protein n=1 Tax=Lacimicrobium alkaliphilum TaxID=1526571 RepID=A0ABQ1RU32_9ALTE|nr:hypothetical protein [Lacimicrobium alkaliphilum]GGD78261.1 hypothetical protein GCM10011357_36680 [Lacimicrobium alkaliphilum]
MINKQNDNHIVTEQPKKRLSARVRILIGLASLPSLALGYMLVVTALNTGVAGISAFELVYSVIGLVAVYIAVTGKRLF